MKKHGYAFEHSPRTKKQNGVWTQHSGRTSFPNHLDDRFDALRTGTKAMRRIGNNGKPPALTKKQRSGGELGEKKQMSPADVFRPGSNFGIKKRPTSK